MSLKENAPLLVSALLVTRKNNNQTEILNVLAKNKTKYGFPGGKLEENESPLEAVIRETQEELGVTPTDLVQVGVYDALTPEGRGIKMYVFVGKVSDEITPMNEIAELHWLTYSQMNESLELLTPMTTEHVLPLIKQL
jgi:ADP-ribose pyrophosphatase YjhB (NUDIX family)